jgi:hypothetical protein
LYYTPRYCPWWDLIKRLNIKLVSFFLFLLHACNT